MKSVFFIAMEIPRVWMDNECAIFDPAAGGKVGPIALENNIDRLLPKRLRHKMKGCLSAAVDHDNQSLYQIGVKRIIVSANPEEIIQGDARGITEISQGITQEERDILALFQQLLKKSSVDNTLWRRF